jgi:hypothetical protein
LNHCYTGVLANHYDLSQENLAFPGASLQSMQWNLMWWLDNHTDEYINNSVLLVGLTEESRFSWYNPLHESVGNDPDWNKHQHSVWLHESSDNIDSGWFKLHKHYLNMTACDELYDLNYKTTARIFDGIGSVYKIPVVQFNLLSQNSIDIDTLHDINTRNILKNHYKKHGHPTEEGHRIIANSLKEILNSELI